jgi:hypothetical protein
VFVIRRVSGGGCLRAIPKNDSVVSKIIPRNRNRRKELPVLNAIKINLSRQEIIGAVKSMNKKDRDDFLEELLASTSPEYLESIKEARADYKAGRVKTHDEVFGH